MTHRLTTHLRLKNAGGSHTFTLVIAESDNAAELALLGSRLLERELVGNISVSATALVSAETPDDSDTLTSAMRLAVAYLEAGHKPIGDDLNVNEPSET